MCRVSKGAQVASDLGAYGDAIQETSTKLDKAQKNYLDIIGKEGEEAKFVNADGKEVTAKVTKADIIAAENRFRSASEMLSALREVLKNIHEIAMQGIHNLKVSG